MSAESDSYGPDAEKAGTLWATCGKCGVREQRDRMSPAVVDGKTVYVHPAEVAQPGKLTRCDRFKAEREIAEAKRGR